MAHTTMHPDAHGPLSLDVKEHTHTHTHTNTHQIQNHGKHRKQKVRQVNRQSTTVVDKVSTQHKQEEGEQGEGGPTIWPQWPEICACALGGASGPQEKVARAVNSILQPAIAIVCTTDADY